MTDEFLTIEKLTSAIEKFNDPTITPLKDVVNDELRIIALKLSSENERLREALEGMLEYSTMCESWQDHEGKAYVERARQALEATNKEK